MHVLHFQHPINNDPFLIFFMLNQNDDQMYGRYTKDLSEYAKDEARRLKQLERQRKKDDRARNKVGYLVHKSSSY